MVLTPGALPFNTLVSGTSCVEPREEFSNAENLIPTSRLDFDPCSSGAGDRTVTLKRKGGGGGDNDNNKKTRKHFIESSAIIILL